MAASISAARWRKRCNNTKDPLLVALPVISRREREVLSLIAEGFTNPEIAEKLFVSPFTVDSHRKNLIAKLNVKNTAMLIRFAVEHKLV
ncbi:response regulator transcription factor [Puia sp. P3]|uniref:response regulator transcription factor n=1 Tax=Puia sp. P3 TaxID=3423952 RepID=UPI003D66F305